MTNDDAFERLAERETLIQRRRMSVDDPSSFMDLAVKFIAGLGVAWALLLVAHWAFFSEPRWLVLVHSVTFFLVTAYWCTAYLFMRIVRRRMPDMFDEST